MTPPTAERIKWEQHAYKRDTEQNFSVYMNQYRDFYDEKNLA